MLEITINKSINGGCSAAFDRVSHQGILYKLCCVGIRCSVLSILTQFLSNQSLHVMVDGCRSKLVDVAVRSVTGKCLGPVIVPPVHQGAFSILENKLICYNDDSIFFIGCAIPRR